MQQKLNIIKNFYNWLSDFFQKPFGLFIFFCSLVLAGIWYSEKQLEQGKVDGESFAKTLLNKIYHKYFPRDNDGILFSLLIITGPLIFGIYITTK